MTLAERITARQSRILKKKYEYNQRHTAQGQWWILKQHLALANQTVVLTDKTAEQLLRRNRIKPLLVFESLRGSRLTVFTPAANVKIRPRGQRIAKDMEILSYSPRHKNILFL